jgi:hypothetical protein
MIARAECRPADKGVPVQLGKPTHEWLVPQPRKLGSEQEKAVNKLEKKYQKAAPKPYDGQGLA